MTEVTDRTGATGVVVREIASIEEAETLSDAWHDLALRALDSEPFLSPEWYLSWWRGFGEGRMMLLAAYRGDRLVGVAPLRIGEEEIAGRPSRVLRLWSNPYSNRANLVLDSEAAADAARALVDAMYARSDAWDVARLEPVLREGEATRAVTDALAERGARWGLRDMHASPYVQLPASMDALMNGLSGSYRESLRRKDRKAEGTGVVTHRSCGASPEDVEPAFEISRHTWQHEAGTGITSKPSIERFYREVAARTARHGWLRMAYLLRDELPVAYEYNLMFDGTLYGLKVAYHADHSDLSPGLVLKLRVLEEAIADGVDAYDFLGEAEPYKMHWTHRVRPLAELRVHRRGLAPWAEHVARFRLRPFLVRRMPWVLEARRRWLDARGEAD
ncbi:MAG TPA: GNAT family N-acetyltransferase [Gemmatimonadota bacterium]|nr:GNAT family N-acetyltransferase [Gemmatimonadota bacterium]